jgi:antitoxin component of MazEF toxin-antitoxin module
LIGVVIAVRIPRALADAIKANDGKRAEIKVEMLPSKRDGDRRLSYRRKFLMS